MLGEVKILFGKVLNVMDEKFIYRCQIQIPGYTDELEPESLPWYFPWYGVNYLPEDNHIVPVLIFDNNFSTGFYGKTCGLLDFEGLLEPNQFTEDDYRHFLNIFSRKVNDVDVKLTYNPTDGIQFINDKSHVQQLPDLYNLWVDTNHIQVTVDKIYLGEGGFEEHPALLGDITRNELNSFEDFIKDHLNKLYDYMDKIKTAAASSPYTKPIEAAITGFLPQIKQEISTLSSDVRDNSEYGEKIKSVRTFLKD